MNFFNNKLLIFTLKLTATLLLSGLCLMLIAKEFRRAKIVTVNHLLPESYATLDHALRPGATPDKKDLQRYLSYFRAVSAAYPGERAFALTLSAFCHTRLGNTAQATAALERAVKLQPDFFWNYYNLSNLLLASGELEKAEVLLKQGLSLPPGKTLQIMLASRVYAPLLSEALKNGLIPDRSLLEGYNRTFKTLVICLEKQNKTQEMLKAAYQWQEFRNAYTLNIPADIDGEDSQGHVRLY